MKLLTLTLLSILSFSAFSQGNGDYKNLLELSTNMVEAESFSQKVPADNCSFSVYADSEEIILIVTAYNPNTDTGFLKDVGLSVRLNTNALPLQEGVEYSMNNSSSIQYQDGVLKYYSKTGSAQYFGLSKDITDLKIEIDPTLTQVGLVEGIEYTKRHLAPNVYKTKISCQF